MKILYVSPELTPFTHGGSLGTIMGDLATAAIQAGHEVTAIAPFRAETSPQRFGLARRLDTITVRGARPAIECVLYEGSLRGRDGALRLLEHEASFGHGDQATARQDDHHSAYALAQATLQFLEADSTTPATTPDLIHCAGWQTGLLAMLLRRHDRFSDIPIVFTFDAPQATGRFPSAILDELGLGYDNFNPDGIEFFGDVSLLKAGIIFANEILVPSPALVEDLQREGHGAGLHGLYAARAAQLHGIAPGLQRDRWNPRAGLHLAAPYDDTDPAPKAQTKAAFQKEQGFQPRSTNPLIICPGPFDADDGLEALIDAADELLASKIQLVFTGVSDDGQHAALNRFAANHKERVALIDASFDADVWHRLLGAADGLLLLRDSEERRLLTLRGLRYGVTPIAPGDGALRDRVVDFDVLTKTGNGFRFAATDNAALLTAIHRFSNAMNVAEQALALRTNAMRLDIAWTHPFALISEVYGTLVQS